MSGQRDPRRRRALTNVGGAIEVEGNRADADALAHALAVPPATDDDDDPARSYVHGFHTYPARMHPVTAARLVNAFMGLSGCVLDPFCGSGTVIVEALIAGRAAVGTDLNPLAPIPGLPTTIFINRAGRVVDVHVGVYDSQGSLDGDVETYALGG